MSKHHHTGRLNPPLAANTELPKQVYGALVGVADGPLSDADDNHVFIWLRIHAGNHVGRYKLAFNVESTDNSQVQYYLYDEQITPSDVPVESFTADATLSYKAMGLKQAEFKSIANGKLRTLVHSSVQNSDLVAAHGFTFNTGDGMHDLHMNNGERPGSPHKNQPNKDGALAFYFKTNNQDVRRWIFIKFATQDL